jgi:hypothetical protein
VPPLKTTFGILVSTFVCTFIIANNTYISYNFFNDHDDYVRWIAHALVTVSARNEVAKNLLCFAGANKKTYRVIQTLMTNHDGYAHLFQATLVRSLSSSCDNELEKNLILYGLCPTKPFLQKAEECIAPQPLAAIHKLSATLFLPEKAQKLLQEKIEEKDALLTIQYEFPGAQPCPPSPRSAKK